jgi:long-chain acyl-CoA synthetase
MFERTCGYYTVLFAGGCIGYAEDLTTVANDAEKIRPTILLTIPRVLEKAYSIAVEKVEGGSAIKRFLVRSAIKNLNEYVNLNYKRKPVPLMLKLKCSILNTLVASKFRKLGGGRIRLIVSGAAPLNRQIAKILYVLGFNIVEGYGLTETAPVVTCSAVEDNRLGTVGKPFEGVEIKIGENSEILVRGPNVMKGYFNKPEETAKVLDPDGWFHTGDQGVFDEYGNLVITGRIKELIITSSGKNIAPAPIEAKISMSPFVEQIILHGDRRKYLVALVVPCVEFIEQYASEKNISYEVYPKLLTTNEIRDLIKHEIEEATFNLASYQKIKAFALLDECFSVENGMLTPTLKPKRHKIYDNFSSLIDTMHGEKVRSVEQGTICFFEREN